LRNVPFRVAPSVSFPLPASVPLRYGFRRRLAGTGEQEQKVCQTLTALWRRGCGVSLREQIFLSVQWLVSCSRRWGARECVNAARAAAPFRRGGGAPLTILRCVAGQARIPAWLLHRRA